MIGGTSKTTLICKLSQMGRETSVDMYTCSYAQTGEGSHRRKAGLTDESSTPEGGSAFIQQC